MANYHHALRNALQGTIDPKSLQGDIGPISGKATQDQIRAFADAKVAYESVPQDSISKNAQAVAEKLGKQAERAVGVSAYAENSAVTAAKALKAERDKLDKAIEQIKKDKPEKLTQAIEEAKAAAKPEIEKLEKTAKKTAARSERISKIADKRLVREHEFLTGEKGVEIANGTGKTSVKMDATAAEAYKKTHQSFDAIVDKTKLGASPAYVAKAGTAAEAAKDGEKAGMFAKAKANGFFKTAGENLNPMGKNAAGEARVGMKLVRYAGVGTGLYIAGKGVGQLFSGNEEDSKLMAVGKVLVGGGLAAVSAVAGR